MDCLIARASGDAARGAHAAQEVMRIEAHVGPMGSGKSTTLYQKANALAHVRAYIPLLDTRSGAMIKTHAGDTFPATRIQNLKDVEFLADACPILVDECHFFSSEDVDQLAERVQQRRGILLLAGLDFNALAPSEAGVAITEFPWVQKIRARGASIIQHSLEPCTSPGCKRESVLSIPRRVFPRKPTSADFIGGLLDYRAVCYACGSEWRALHVRDPILQFDTMLTSTSSTTMRCAACKTCVEKDVSLMLAHVSLHLAPGGSCRLLIYDADFSEYAVELCSAGLQYTLVAQRPAQFMDRMQ